MKRLIASISFIVFLGSFSGAQTNSPVGAFSRLGFGARGMAMGNALAAVGNGEISTYYNPSLAVFANGRTASATFGILSLDRYLNFLSYTQAIQPRGGFSLGLINSGVRKIDGRDIDGQHTEDYSTTENQFYLTFANRFTDEFSLGVSVKMYYAKLFDKVTSSTVGFDVGGFVQITPELSVGAAIKDLGSKYKWDTTPIYSQNGKSTTDKFPTLRRVGLAYALPNGSGTVAADFENRSDGVNSFHFGAEYAFVESFTLRGGVDRMEFGDDATGAKPSLGFTVKNSFNGWTPTLTYAYVFESFAPHGMNIITLSIVF